MSGHTQEIRNAQSIRLNILPGESVVVKASFGNYDASIVQGAGLGAIATAATSGTYGPYATGIAILLTASSTSEIYFAIGVSPVISLSPALTQLSTASETSLSTLLGAVRVGSGTAPSWGDQYNVVTQGVASIYAGDAMVEGFGLAFNTRNDGAAWRTINTGAAILLALDNGGEFRLWTGASAAAGAGTPLTNRIYINNAGNTGFGVTPTARLHLAAGVATASGAPLKLTAGANLTTPENGAIEFDGTNVFITVGGVRKTFTII